MAPTETQILSAFLLPPAPLPTMLSLPKFTALFPAPSRSSPQIPLLYRDLQHTRALSIDAVRRNIAAEAKRGEGQRREVIRTRRREDRGELEGLDVMEGFEGVGMEVIDSNTMNSNTSGKAHTLTTILPEMETACEELEEEIAELNAEAERIERELQGTIGGLSDLRYGKFAPMIGGGEMKEDVLEGLKALKDICGKGADGG